MHKNYCTYTKHGDIIYYTQNRYTHLYVLVYVRDYKNLMFSKYLFNA